MSKPWPRVKLGEVLLPVDRAVPANLLTEIDLAGVYSFGNGLFKRGKLAVAGTSYKKYNRLVADDFVISQPKAWEGAVALVTPEFEGWFLSPVFPVFSANTEKLSPHYLSWYCRQAKVWDQIQAKSKGMGARRETVSADQFLSLEIPLPPIDEQRRIVARIDEIASHIAHAERLRKSRSLEQEALCRSLIANDPSTKFLTVADVVRQRALDVIVQPDQSYQFAGVYSFGRGVFKGQIKSGVEFAYPKLSRIKAGDFIYPKLMAWEGALGVVPSECDGCVVSPEFPVFEIDENTVLPDVFDVYFRDPQTWEGLQGGSTGTNARRRRLNPTDFLKLKVPIPSKETQRKLRDVRRLQSQLAATQADATRGALFASVLNELLTQTRNTL